MRKKDQQEVTLNVISFTKTFQLDKQQFTELSQAFVDVAVHTDGLALIYDGYRNTLVLIEGKFDEEGSFKKS